MISIPAKPKPAIGMKKLHRRIFGERPMMITETPDTTIVTNRLSFLPLTSLMIGMTIPLMSIPKKYNELAKGTHLALVRRYPTSSTNQSEVPNDCFGTFDSDLIRGALTGLFEVAQAFAIECIAFVSVVFEE